jgi:hypothetical protein
MLRGAVKARLGEWLEKTTICRETTNLFGRHRHRYALKGRTEVKTSKSRAIPKIEQRAKSEM